MTSSLNLRQSGLATLVSLLFTFVAGSALAAIPSTADHRNATVPMITGRAISVSEHDLVVETEQGDQVVLSLDSRTMLPSDLAQDMMVRVEFHYLDDGARYAQRVIPTRHGETMTRELAYSRDRDGDDDDDADLAYASSSEGGAEPMTRATTAVTHQARGTEQSPIPGTEGYLLATQAMIVGEVVKVSDHHIVVETDQGQRVALEMDSRTLVPTDLESGLGVRIEYRAMDNGAKLAKRIVPARLESLESRELAYPPPDEDQDMGPQEPSQVNASTAAYAEPEDHPASAPDADDHDADDRKLPQTASLEPLFVLLGLLALGGGAAMMLRQHSQVG